MVVAGFGAVLGQRWTDAHGQGATIVAEFVWNEQDGNAASRVRSQIDDLVVAVNLFGIARYGVPVHENKIVVLVEDVEIVDVQQTRQGLVYDAFVCLSFVKDLLLLQSLQQMGGYCWNRFYNG